VNTGTLVALVIVAYLIVGTLVGTGVAWMLEVADDRDIRVYIATVLWPLVFVAWLVCVIALAPGSIAGWLYRRFLW
jgi:hypothetical protein